METVWSPNRHPGRVKRVRLVVVHSMEASERSTTAEAVAKYFQIPSVQASAHICADNDSRVRCVRDEDTAWAAPGANADGLQLELAGYARQSRAEWLDSYSARMLEEQAAAQVRDWCRAHRLPVRHLTNAELAAGKAGLIGHVQASQVYKRSTHTDPGAGFPWPEFLEMVGPSQGDDDVTPEQDQRLKRIEAALANMIEPGQPRSLRERMDDIERAQVERDAAIMAALEARP